MMTVDDALKLAEDVENHGEKRSNSLSGQALAALAGEVRRLRQEVDDRRNYMNKIWHHIGDFPLWDGDEIVYMKGSGVIT